MSGIVLGLITMFFCYASIGGGDGDDAVRWIY